MIAHISFICKSCGFEWTVPLGMEKNRCPSCGSSNIIIVSRTNSPNINGIEHEENDGLGLYK